jgi:cytosolic carboxypeptidase protein 2/3
VDLNRQWKSPVKTAHPTIHALKSFMHLMRKTRDINMYIDLHGHSRKYNVFMYGCDDKKKAKPLVRAFPKFFSSHSVGGKYVSYADCSFHVRKGRESTARVVVSKELNIPLSFTLEATFCGSNYGPYQVLDSRLFTHFALQYLYLTILPHAHSGTCTPATRHL